MNKKKSPVTQMELLAPAGSFSAFEAAIIEGADAVYLGAPELNARALARDFTFDEIGAMVGYAHQKNVKVYIAMNSLVKEAELSLAVKSLAYFDAMKVDALIVQDIGLLHLARQHFSNLNIHASTLTSAHNSLAVEYLVSLGCKRVVLPRELTLKEIGDIADKTGAELEVFVHGAMCFSYSGLCLFSSLHGGKSSLRGQCVQPCRRRYAWLKKKSRKGSRQQDGKEGGYLFSMNDLNALELLPELGRVGVKSLKIEGRLKSAEYVRKTVKAYRLVLDNISKSGNEMQSIQRDARKLIDEAMGRRWSTGFFLQSKPHQAVTPHFSGNVGLMVGKVNSLKIKTLPGGKKSAGLDVSLRHPLHIGDRLRLHDEKTGQRASFTLRSLQLGRKKVQQANAGQTVHIESDLKFTEQQPKKFQGSLFKVDIGSDTISEKKIRAKILKHRLLEITFDEQGSNFDKLSDIPSKVFSRKIADAPGGKRNYPHWWVKIARISDMQFRLPVNPDAYVLPITDENVRTWLNYRPKSHAEIIWSLPAVISEEKLAWFKQACSLLLKNDHKQFQVGHISQFSLFNGANRKTASFKIYADYTVNILNSLSLSELHLEGFAGTLFSVETDRENMAEALNNYGNRSEFSIGTYVFGRPPLFTARLDAEHFSHGRRFISPKREEYILRRTDDMTIAMSVLPFSLLDEWKNIGRMHVDYLLVDLSIGNMKRNVQEFIAHFHTKGEQPAKMTGNFFETLA